ncbi:MAG: radical SAM protein [Alphaproteobacteria bacterium]
MAKVLFINPTVRHHDSPRHVPYGMAILVAQAMNAGHQVQVYDENAWRPEDPEATVTAALQADDWDVIATGGLTTTYNSLKKILITAKRKCPDALLVAGNGFLSSMPRDMMEMRPEIDIGVIGEAYVTFPEILQRVDAGQTADWTDCKGVIWRDAAGEIKLTAPRGLLESNGLNELPYPAHDMFPLEKYWENSGQLFSEAGMTVKKKLDINASYGCALICRFCWHLGLIGDTFQHETPKGKDVFFTYDRQLRWHSPEYIVKMVKHWYDKYQIDYIGFLDENLMTMHRSSRGKWLPEICRLWIEYGLQPDCVRNGVPHDENCTHGVHWGGTSHAGQVDRNILTQMYQAGCIHLDYGLETFNDRVLDNIGKGSTVRKNKDAITMTMEAGIRPIPNQILGFPDEFFDSIYDDIKAWEEMGVVCYPFLATAYPGSEWYTVYKDKVLEQYDGDLEAFISDLDDATKITANICENFTTVELLGIRELMVAFNYRKLKQFEAEWWSRHKTVKLPKFLAKGWRDRVQAVVNGERADPYAQEMVELTREQYKDYLRASREGVGVGLSAAAQ